MSALHTSGQIAAEHVVQAKHISAQASENYRVIGQNFVVSADVFAGRKIAQRVVSKKTQKMVKDLCNLPGKGGVRNPVL